MQTLTLVDTWMPSTVAGERVAAEWLRRVEAVGVMAALVHGRSL